MQWRRDEFTLDTARERLDMHQIATTLATTYWAAGRPPELVRESWRASAVVFGLYRDAELLGWARVVTDFVTHAYLADVYVDPFCRGRGLGIWLVETVLAHPELQRVGWLLQTRDAHGLYERFGFERLSERVMQRPKPVPPPQTSAPADPE